MKAYRQGELIFIPKEIKDVEDLKKELAKGKSTTVIAEGEATGHKHELADPATAVLVSTSPGMWIESSNPMYDNIQKILHTEMGTVIKHPEHADLRLPGGTYYIRTEREYDEETTHRVMD